MATEAKPKLTYDDLLALPEDNIIRDLIDGELFVTAAPGYSHQAVVLRLAARLLEHCETVGGGSVVMAPRDVYLDHMNVVEPDIVYVSNEHRERDEERFVRGAPDIVVEVSSPSTRRLELVRKRELYERSGVPEYWCVDLQADAIYVDRLHEGRYGDGITLERGAVLTSPLLPGFEIEVDYLLGPKEPGTTQ